MKAICIDNEGYEVSLTKGKKYIILPYEEDKLHNLIRVIDDTGEDYLYNTTRFKVSNKTELIVKGE